MTIAVDLDGTLAYYESGQFPKIGEPIVMMMNRVIKWLAEDKKVVIFTARIHGNPEQYASIRNWLNKQSVYFQCEKLKFLEITNIKTPDIEEFWDDRAIAVVKNLGISKDV